MTIQDGLASAVTAATTVDASWEPYTDNAYLGFVGGFFMRQVEGREEYALRVAQHHLNMSGIVHGGLTATMLDHVVGRNCLLAAPGVRLATSNLNVNFVRAVMLGDFVEGRCEVRKAGRSAVYADGLLYVGEKVVAMAQGVFLAVRP